MGCKIYIAKIKRDLGMVKRGIICLSLLMLFAGFVQAQDIKVAGRSIFSGSKSLLGKTYGFLGLDFFIPLVNNEYTLGTLDHIDFSSEVIFMSWFGISYETVILNLTHGDKNDNGGYDVDWVKGWTISAVFNIPIYKMLYEHNLLEYWTLVLFSTDISISLGWYRRKQRSGLA
jgi:hypothetical protein